MLKQGLDWVLYGDRTLFIQMVLGYFLGGGLVGLWLIQPAWSAYQREKNAFIDLGVALQEKQKFIQGMEPLEPPRHVFRPLPQLSQEFGLMILREAPHWYFSGPAESLIEFLNFLLMQGYAVKEFRLVKIDYKMMLAVRL